MGRNSFCSHFSDKTDLPVNNLRYFHPYKEIQLKCRTSLLYLQIYLTYTQHPNMKGLVIKYKQQNFQIASTEGIVSCLSVIASKERLMLENGGNGQAAGCMNLRLQSGMTIEMEITDIEKTSPPHSSVYPPLFEPEEKHPELLLQHYHRIEALLRGEKVTTPKMKGLAIQYNEEKNIIALSPNIVTLALNICYPGGDIACLSGIGIQEEHITWLCQPIKQGDRIRVTTTEGVCSSAPIKTGPPGSREKLEKIHSQLEQELNRQGILPYPWLKH